MPTERLSMRHLRELLRLRHDAGLRQAAIAISLGLSQSSVCKYLKLIWAGRCRQNVELMRTVQVVGSYQRR